jgi:hypothetical protein
MKFWNNCYDHNFLRFSPDGQGPILKA